ncbi:E3 ubiquitin-protein ligase RNF19B-like [Ylistrum balloti]|uniref:E3 ubiquitin-protein ligase RNF19B-like n=1 Tax=Ylistrum balloti TaxID=509963 RepID=UPI002905EFD1|nr:E3 ubiquitin-protein ligase RNF19B-like [Ylistrum balloti]
MQVPGNSVGVWKFGDENFFTSVPKAWTVSDCITHVRNKIGRYGYGDIDLWIKNRCIMLDKRKSLSDYPGLKSLHVVRRPLSRDPHPSYATSCKDDTDPFCDSTTVGMSCGHFISPDNLYQYAWRKIQEGTIEVTCPAVPDTNRPAEQCSKEWDFQSISKIACLSDDENYMFCSKLFSNLLERESNIHICPGCNEAIFSNCANILKCSYCEKSGRSFSYCVKCHQAVYRNTCSNPDCKESLPKIRALLQNCHMITIVDVPNCPSVRACPKCSCVIEFDEAESCKHMTCPRNFCQTKFCFICLKVKTDQYYWPCGGAFDPCSPTPRQIV